jgi:hypothetical protein
VVLVHWATHLIQTGETTTSVIDFMFNPDLQDELQKINDIKHAKQLAVRKQMQVKMIACPQFFQALDKLEIAISDVYKVLKASPDKRSAQVIIKDKLRF